MLELLILGELLNKPAYGYTIKQSLDDNIGFWKIVSWGSLYPILRRLEKGGMVIREVGHQQGGPQQKVYTVTPDGEKYFLKMMLQPPNVSEDRGRLFRYKMLYFNKITKQQRLHIIEDYLHENERMLAFVMGHLENNKLRHKPKGKLHYVAKLITYSAANLQNESIWLKEFLREEQLK